MTERDALLAAILEHPDDDTPRLIMADYLTDHGEEERGQFIQHMIDAERCPQPKFMRFFDTLESHYREWFPLFMSPKWLPANPGNLLAFSPEWIPGHVGQMRPHMPLPWSSVVSRGFVSEITTDWNTWQRYADQLVWHGPMKCNQCNGKGTVVCSRCRGTARLAGWHEGEGDFPCGCNRGVLDCYSCKGTGEIPAATMECPGCGGDGWGRLEYQRSRAAGKPDVLDSCTFCSGSGRIPRPMPATAQPIDIVRLTTMPDNESILAIAREVGDAWNPVGDPDRLRKLLALKWPSVKNWILPQANSMIYAAAAVHDWHYQF
jgi:uncharacterized protein (TIGR02996 family)